LTITSASTASTSRFLVKMASNPSVLLTGATGSLGASLLEQLLATDYKVYAVLRSAKKSQQFLEKKYPQHIKNNTLEFIEIPDMTVPGVFDEGASKTTYIIHVATPLSYSNFQEEMITPASIVDHNLLTAAHKSTTVKRVVITGSVVSVMFVSRDLMAGKTFTEEDFNPLTLEDALENVSGAYSYSKVTSEKLAWDFIKNEKPNFDLVVLLAPSITGRCIQEGFVPDKKALGGMGAIYGQIFDKEELGFIYPWTM
jgi:nucleoside-diphosphate-sugar epimerase